MTPNRNHILSSALSDLGRYLEFYAASGRGRIEYGPRSLEIINEFVRGPVQGLGPVRAEMGDCRRCPLAEGRTNVVFGEGDEQADLVFVGEGPGEDEDRLGKPFVGKAGELLTRIIEAMTLTRDRVYIANIVKCRPPKNRDPLTEEIERCLPFLFKQLAAIRPKVIVTLGNVPTKTLLQTETGIMRLRGKWHELALPGGSGVDLMPTFHPAFLLRNSSRKREVWDDMQQVMNRLGLRRGE